MERAHRNVGVRTLRSLEILGIGDFIDTRASGNWFDRIMTPKLAKGVFVYPGDPTIPHAWVYLPDPVRAAEGLARQADMLPRFTVPSFPGYTLTGKDTRS